VIDASAITDIDYSVAQSVRDFIDELKRRGVQIVFAPIFDRTWIDPITDAVWNEAMGLKDSEESE
jgi:STAS domain